MKNIHVKRYIFFGIILILAIISAYYLVCLYSTREVMDDLNFVAQGGKALNRESDVIERVDDANEFIENCLKLSDEYVEEFCAKYILDDYILLEENKPYDYEILKCLALFHKNETNKAVNYALNMVKSGNAGRFISGGRGFFERVLDKYGVKV